jgi:4-amino-4-deoxy-L-arabinose transferase-like glycosyltransferase
VHYGYIVLFCPREVKRVMRKTEHPCRFWCLLVLLFVSIFLLFFRLGQAPFLDYDEATYSQIVRESIDSREYMTLHYLSEPWFEKPPLYFWLASVSLNTIDDFEFAMRLPSALSGVLVIFLVYQIIFIITKDRFSGLVGGLVVLSTAGFFEASRNVNLDVLVTFFILLALYGFLKGQEDRRWLSVIGVGLGLGILSKSVVVLLALPIVFLFSIFSDYDYSWLRDKHLRQGLIFGLLLIIPWHLHQTYLHGSLFWNSYLFVHVFERFSQNILLHDVSKFFYLKTIYSSTFPWLFVFLAGALALLFWHRRFHVEKSQIRTISSIAFSFFAILGFFMVAQTKVAFYLIPLYPLLAIFAGTLIFIIRKRLKNSLQKFVFGFVVLFIMIVGFSHSISIGFHQREASIGFEYEIAKENERAGHLIKNETGPKALYTYNYERIQTIVVYSGEKNVYKYIGSHVQHLLEDGGKAFVLAPSHKIDEFIQNANRDIKGAGIKVLHSAETFSLIKIEMDTDQ